VRLRRVLCVPAARALFLVLCAWRLRRVPCSWCFVCLRHVLCSWCFVLGGCAACLVLGALCACGTCLVLGALCLVNEDTLPKLRRNSPSTRNKAQSTRHAAKPLQGTKNKEQRTAPKVLNIMSWKSFEEIEAWQVARILNQRVWELIQSGQFGKDFALSDQLNRSAGSAMDNIAEGFDGGSNAEFARFLSYSQRSCSEVRSQLIRAHDRNHIEPLIFEELTALTMEIHRKSGGLIKRLKVK